MRCASPALSSVALPPRCPCLFPHVIGLCLRTCSACFPHPPLPSSIFVHLRSLRTAHARSSRTFPSLISVQTVPFCRLLRMLAAASSDPLVAPSTSVIDNVPSSRHVPFQTLVTSLYLLCSRIVVVSPVPRHLDTIVHIFCPRISSLSGKKRIFVDGEVGSTGVHLRPPSTINVHLHHPLLTSAIDRIHPPPR